MLPVRQQAEVDRLLYEVNNLEEVVQAVSKLETSQQLFALASHYNWDDGTEVPQAISKHPLCDFATALLLFWHSDAVECFGDGTVAPEYQESWFIFCKEITKALLDGNYALGPNAGCHCWLVQQCEAGTRGPLPGKPDSGTHEMKEPRRRETPTLILIPDNLQMRRRPWQVE